MTQQASAGAATQDGTSTEARQQEASPERDRHTAVVRHDAGASANEVFRAWTVGFDRWFAEPGTSSLRAEPDLPFFFSTQHEGQRHPHYGRVLRVEPGRELEITWVNEAGTHGVETLVRVELEPAGEDRCAIRLVHTGFPSEQGAAEHKAAWVQLLRDRLDPLLAAGAPVGVREEEFGVLFDAFDTDHDGQIGQLDLDVLVQRWCVALHVAPGTRAWLSITGRANRLWQDLLGHRDSAGNKQVSRQEWVDSHDRPAFVRDAAIPWAIGVFDIGDPDETGRVSLQAWMTCQSVTGWDQMESLHTFQQLDDNQDGYIERARFTSYIEEFYATTVDNDRWWWTGATPSGPA